MNKHPYPIVGVAPPDFHGTLMFFSPDLFVPLVNEELLEGTSLLEAWEPLGVPGDENLKSSAWHQLSSIGTWK